MSDCYSNDETKSTYDDKMSTTTDGELNPASSTTDPSSACSPSSSSSELDAKEEDRHRQQQHQEEDDDDEEEDPTKRHDMIMTTASSTISDDASSIATCKATLFQPYNPFRCNESTEAHFKIPDGEPKKFYGSYGHVRKQLDYTFHCCYRKERQWLHDSIIEDYLEDVEEEEDETTLSSDIENFGPSTRNISTTSSSGALCTDTTWLIMTAGVKGAGKHYTIQRLIIEDKLPLTNSYIVADQNDIALRLPEYDIYRESSPELVIKLTRKEAKYITETLTWAGLQIQGQTVIWDSALGDVQFFMEYIEKLRNSIPNLKIALFHITADLNVIMERCKQRSKETGVTIDPEQIESMLQALPTAFEQVSNVVDYSCTIRNNGNDLEDAKDDDDDLQLLTESETWDTFREAFSSMIPTTTVTANDDVFGSSPDSHTNYMGLRDSITSLSESNANMAAAWNKNKRKSLLRQQKHRSRRRFSVLTSTEENHSTYDMNFYGQFAHIRKTLDYDYHKNYTFERQRFQDAIIREFLKATVLTDKNGDLGTTPTEPWLVFTAGAMGAGKSYTLRKLVEKKRFPLTAFVNVDPDEIRRRLPEYHLYVSQSPELAGDLTRKEAGFVAEILTLAGLEAGKVREKRTSFDVLRPMSIFHLILLVR